MESLTIDSLEHWHYCPDCTGEYPCQCDDTPGDVEKPCGICRPQRGAPPP